MRRVLFAILSCFGILSSEGSFCQDTIHSPQVTGTKGQFLKIGASGGWFAVKDLETSPLTYRGLLPGIQIGVLFYEKKTVTLFNYDFSYGNQATRNYPISDGNVAKAYNNCLNIGFGRKINTNNCSKSDIYLGANLGIIANFRDNSKFNNANFNYEGFLTFGPMILWEKEVTLLPKQLHLAFLRWPFRQRNLKWSASLYIPVINGVERPPYTTVGDFVDGVSPTFKISQMKVVSFNDMVNLVSTVGLHYFLQNGNNLLLSYQWYFYNYYPSANQVRGVAGFFSFSFLFRLNKKL
jgi:hypothetical protein